MYNIACIMMASGLSKRMGTNKLLIKIKEKAMFEYVLDVVEGIKIKEKIVVSSYDQILAYGREKKYICLKNTQNILGQSMTIRLGVERVKKCDGFMFLPCDMPFIRAEIVRQLCDFFYEEKESIVVPRIDKKNTMPTIFPYSYRKDLLEIRGDMGGRDIIKKKQSKVRYIEIEDKEILRDIDTREELDIFFEKK